MVGQTDRQTERGLSPPGGYQSCFQRFPFKENLSEQESASKAIVRISSASLSTLMSFEVSDKLDLLLETAQKAKLESETSYGVKLEMILLFCP